MTALLRISAELYTAFTTATLANSAALKLIYKLTKAVKV